MRFNLIVPKMDSVHYSFLTGINFYCTTRCQIRLFGILVAVFGYGVGIEFLSDGRR